MNGNTLTCTTPGEPTPRTISCDPEENAVDNGDGTLTCVETVVESTPPTFCEEGDLIDGQCVVEEPTPPPPSPEPEPEPEPETRT